LSELKIYGNPWIFFSPNNDHPYLNEGSVIKEYITAAEKAEELYKDHLVSIWYSHFTENINDISMKKPLWGYYSRIFKKIVMNSEKYYLVKANKLQLDSLKIIRLNYLIKIFQGVNHKGRIIRMEETPYHLSKRIREITVVPKLELCRHYDGYDFFMEKVPPLFIPEGFEKNKIKIRYGYDDYKNGWINVNPNNDKYGLSKNSSDLLCNLDQLPKFWSKKIGELDINKDFIEIKPNKYEYDLENPWSENSILKNIVKSTLRWLDPSFTIKHFYHHRFINFFKKYN